LYPFAPFKDDEYEVAELALFTTEDPLNEPPRGDEELEGVLVVA
jgi:hypothetical protein